MEALNSLSPYLLIEQIRNEVLKEGYCIMVQNSQRPSPNWLIEQMREELIKEGYCLIGQSNNAIESKYKYFKEHQD